ncbi:hypothetical protein AB8E32_02940 [Marinomonas polaris]|uniref:hypothetical protein n=1 Tax=Marinomonas polaris TaxID=293552 RepID=UPI00351914C2
MNYKGKLVFIAALIITLSAFGAYFSVFRFGLSENASDWGSFGSYIAGVVTVPFSLASLYFLYKSYRATQDNLFITQYQNEIFQAHSAIKDAALFVDESLKEYLQIGGEKISFREAHNDLSKFEKLVSLIKSDKVYNHRYRVSVGKPMLCLYDFLSEAQIKFGITPTIRFYKIRYQWLIQLHNDYDIQIIHAKKYGITSELILDFFYTTDER